jgi:protein ImuB
MAFTTPRRARPDLLPAVPAARPVPRPGLAGGGARRGGGEDEAAARAQPLRELWLTIHLPQLALDALQVDLADVGVGAARTAPDTRPAPLAVIDLDGSARRVCDCNAAARAAGVVPGMALNAALVLQPSLLTRAREPRREQELLQRLAEWALRSWTPRVSHEPPDSLLLEVRGSLRLFGGLRALRETLAAQLLDVGLTARLACAPTPLASLWLARSCAAAGVLRLESLPARLAPLPLACTRWPPAVLATLATMGVRTLGECLRLPRDGFARRCGPALLEALDRATGRRPDPRASVAARERYLARRTLEPEIAEAPRLEHAARPLLEELCAFLRTRRAVVQGVELQLRHRMAPDTRLRLRFAEPTAELARIAPLLRERLAQQPLPEPVRELRLRSATLLEARELPVELFASESRRGQRVPQLVERLRARLGVEAVHGLCLVPEHRPEAAWRVAEPEVPARPVARRAKRASTTTTPSVPSPLPPAPRPVWLLSVPQTLELAAGRARAGLPRFEGKPLQLESGPERIESGWWDGRDVARDYYVACTAAGARLWIYRERRAQGTPGWFVHGVFG